jgi:hypothetical protein
MIGCDFQSYVSGNISDRGASCIPGATWYQIFQICRQTLHTNDATPMNCLTGRNSLGLQDCNFFIGPALNSWRWRLDGTCLRFPRTRRMRVPSQQLRWDTFRSRVCCYRHCPCTHGRVSLTRNISLGRVSDAVLWKQVILKQNR